MQFLQACIKIRNPQIIQFLFQLFIACVSTHFNSFEGAKTRASPAVSCFLHRQYSGGTSDAGCRGLLWSVDICAGHADKCAGSLPAALQNCGVCLRLQPHGHIPWQTRARSERNPIIHHQNTSHYGKKSDGT